MFSSYSRKCWECFFGTQCRVLGAANSGDFHFDRVQGCDKTDRRTDAQAMAKTLEAFCYSA